MGEARGSKGGCSPGGGLQFKSKRNGRYAVRGLGARTLGAIVFARIAADVDVMVYWRGCVFSVGIEGGVLY